MSSTQNMQLISEDGLNHLPQRILYLREFIGFTQDDAALLHSARPLIAPLIPVVVDAVYDKLLSFSVTAKAFLPRQTGFTGAPPMTFADLSKDHPQIQFRKDFLAKYLVKLVSMDYEDMASWEYLDKVGLMHTGQPGFMYRKDKPSLRVEYIHCAMLLGYVEDILVNALLNHPDLDLATKSAVTRAFNKVIWIQNDLFARHYMPLEKAKSPITPLNVAIAVLSVVLGCILQFLLSMRA